MNFSLVPSHNDFGLNFDGVSDPTTGNKAFLLNGNTVWRKNMTVENFDESGLGKF